MGITAWHFNPSENLNLIGRNELDRAHMGFFTVLCDDQIPCPER